jgi:Glycosyl transferase family 11.
MVIAQIRSGLGNQMFQYAFAKRLSIVNDAELRLDLSQYGDRQLRAYELNNFAISAGRLRIGERCLARVARSKRFSAARRFSEQMLGGPVTELYDRQTGFDSEAFGARGNLYLEGFWQSWKYFADIRPILLKEFDVLLAYESSDKRILEEIDKTSSVCLHIRRGDYVSDSQTSKLFGVCSPDYYHRSIAYIREHIPMPKFFVFSDELGWAKKTFGEHEDFRYIAHNDSCSPAYDFRLMKRCKHFILSNSTFGWWAAWLSEFPGKLVIAPKSWYKSTWTTDDLIPAEWLTLPNDLI